MYCTALQLTFLFFYLFYFSHISIIQSEMVLPLDIIDFICFFKSVYNIYGLYLRWF